MDRKWKAVIVVAVAVMLSFSICILSFSLCVGYNNTNGLESVRELTDKMEVLESELKDKEEELERLDGLIESLKTQNSADQDLIEGLETEATAQKDKVAELRQFLKYLYEDEKMFSKDEEQAQSEPLPTFSCDCLYRKGKCL